MNYKKRILFCGEASNLSTGFSTYYRELIPRLVATGKYEIAEFGSYVRQDDPKVQEFIQGRWKFYGVMPSTQEEAQVFNQPSPHPRARGQNTNQFGEYKFNSVLADFQPDIVIDIRDWWMLEFQERSVFRPWYKWVVMPTVDAEPQAEEWIKTYENAELVLAYSDYGVHALRRQSQLMPNGKRRMRIFPKAMRPGVDLETFEPMDKLEVRDHWNLNQEKPYRVIGTVMRNQSRKLYPDLIDGFARMKEKYKGNEDVDRAVLLIHSSWPDNAHSYDYPRHIMRLESMEWMPYHHKGLRGSVLQSMFCHSCQEPSVTFAMNLWGKPVQEGRIKLPCPHCGQTDASPPATARGFSREDLAKLYNLMDLYVQCSICFTGETPVLTPYGWQTIQDIEVGDEVIGRDGEPHEVYKVMCNKTDSLVSIILNGSPFETECTHNHPFLVVKDQWPNDKRSLREKIAQKNPDELDFEYKDAGDLKPGDMCVQTIPQQEEDPYLIVGGEDVKIDEDMAWFLGVMIGDGNVNVNNKSPYCRVTCALDDTVAFDRIDKIARRFGREAKRRDYDERAAFDISIYQSVLARSLRTELYDDDKIKKMPSGFELWPMNLQKSLIDGLIHADGHTISDTVVGFTGTSAHVARSLYLALQRLGLYFNAHQQHPKGNRKTRYKFEINTTGQRSSSANLYWKQDDQQYLLSKVKKVSDISRDTEVFNIDVSDDHNYIVCGHTVHNCEGDGMPIQEAKACGVPTLVTDYTAMREKGRYPDYSHFEELGFNKDNYTCPKGGDVINVGRYYYEPETNCKRAHPDVEHLADQMFKMITDPERLERMGREARECAEENYDWNNLWKQWEYILDNIKIKDRSETWDSPIAEHDEVKPIDVPEGLTDEQYVEWLYINVLKYPAVDPEGAKTWVQHLGLGVPREQLMSQFVQIGNQQSDGSKMRDQIRQQMAAMKGESGQGPTTPRKQEFV